MQQLKVAKEVKKSEQKQGKMSSTVTGFFLWVEDGTAYLAEYEKKDKKFSSFKSQFFQLDQNE